MSYCKTFPINCCLLQTDIYVSFPHFRMFSTDCTWHCKNFDWVWANLHTYSLHLFIKYIWILDPKKTKPLTMQKLLKLMVRSWWIPLWDHDTTWCRTYHIQYLWWTKTNWKYHYLCRYHNDSHLTSYKSFVLQ